jgi:HlyD family secretion protein
MKRLKRLIAVLSLLLLVAFAVWRYGLLQRVPGIGPVAPAAAQKGASLFSGVIEATEVQIAAETGGRVLEVTAAEGAEVQAGQVLVRLDPALLDDQIAIAQAQLAVAQAGLSQLKAGARPGTVKIAQAQEDQAQAALQAAQQALADAQTLRDEPQDLQLQVAVARQQVAAAEARVAQAAALKDAAETAQNGLDYAQQVLQNWHYPVPPPSIPIRLQEAPYDVWQGWANLNAAVAARDGASEQLGQLEAQLAAPQTLIAQVDAAQAAVLQAQAAVDAAHAGVTALAAGATPEQLAAAQARVAQAQAALNTLQLQRTRLEISAPISGAVLVRQVEPGEIAAPGAPLLTLASLREVEMVLYVPERDLGQAHVGQGVRVSVDSYPGRVFAGTVVRIANQAEFTPRNVATQEERLNTFYGMRVRLANPDGALKPGMPADATLEVGK